MHNSTHRPIQDMHTIQARPELFYCELVIMTQLQREIWGLSININIINTTMDLPVCTSIWDLKEATARDAHLQGSKAYILQGWLHKKGCGTRHTKILACQTWFGHDRWQGNKRQVNNSAIPDVDVDIEPAAEQPHGKQEDKAVCMWICVLGKYKCWYRKHC